MIASIIASAIFVKTHRAFSRDPMLGLQVFVAAFFLNVHAADSLRSGILSASQGDIVGQSDFQVNLRPPVENAQEIQESLDALAKIEDSKQAAFTETFANEKQRMLSEEKVAIHNLVEEALEPLIGKLKMQ